MQGKGKRDGNKIRIYSNDSIFLTLSPFPFPLSPSYPHKLVSRLKQTQPQAVEETQAELIKRLR